MSDTIPETINKTAPRPQPMAMDPTGSGVYAENFNFQTYFNGPAVSNQYQVNLFLNTDNTTSANANNSSLNQGSNGSSPASVSKLMQHLTQAGVFGDTASTAQTQRFNFMCAETLIPGASFETFSEYGSRQGIEEFFPSRRTYTDMSMTFYVSSDYKILNLFHEWINFIHPLHVGRGGESAGTVLRPRSGGYIARDPRDFHRQRYPSEYKRAFMVTKFEKNFDRYLTFEFVNGFPVNISSLPLRYDEAQLLRVTVDFKYERYFVTNTTTKAQNLMSHENDYNLKQGMGVPMQNLSSNIG